MNNSPYSKKIRSGKWIPKNRYKYEGDINNIVYRSGYELKFLKWCDNTPSIISWSSEEISIPYIHPMDGQFHRYFPDFIIKIKKHNGIKTYIVEVKPKKFSVPPEPKKRKTKGFLIEVKQYAINSAKWEAAKKYAKERGMEFLIITEDDLYDKKRK